MLDQCILREVRILEFVHQHVDESPRVFLSHGRIVLQQARGVDEQVVEVHRVAGDEAFLIFDEDALDDFVAVIRDRVIVRADQIILRLRDRSVDGRGAEAFVVEVKFFDDAFDDPLLVVGVEDDEVALHRQELSLAPQQARADGVEGSQHHPLCGVLAEQGLDAGLHLARGFVGERHRQDLVGTDSLRRDQPGDALGEDARLARARSRQDEDGAASSRHCFALLGVEFVEEIHDKESREKRVESSLRGCSLLANHPTIRVPKCSSGSAWL
ncbi:MAG: hypothetical protein PGMFKBFP_02732 [Anaerolineales bacterium]|nr:hypothetical protein [Anaerolineales bacterium]